MRGWLIKLFGIRPCKRCRGWNTYYGYYSSGWNHLCNQASGDYGRLCTDCWYIEFNESLEIRRVKSPSWVSAYR